MGSPASAGALSAGGAGWLHAASERVRRAARGGARPCFMPLKLAAAASLRNARRPSPKSRLFAWVFGSATLYNRYDGHPRKYGAGREIGRATGRNLITNAKSGLL